MQATRCPNARSLPNKSGIQVNGMQNEKVQKLKLNAPVVVVQEQKVAEITVVRIVDLPGQRIVRAFVAELPQPIVLWEGDDYDKIGNWTQEQANDRIIEVISK
jgi:hypothetical protein